MIKFANCNCEVERGKFDINNIPLDCPAVWKLIGTGHTVGVFQLEKKLGQDWARKVKPENIEELASLESLLRPGPLEAELSQDYVDIKFGRKKRLYLHPLLKSILDSTYGVMCFQEQALKIATDLAGFNPVEADTLRSAIGKKKPELMAKLKDKFVNGAQKYGKLEREIAEEIFSWIEKCQRYSFNKSHAVSYAFTAYQTAWLKYHFPQEFFTSYLTYSKYKSDPKEEVYKLVQDARLFGINIIPPDIRRGNVHFKMINDEIAFGLSHIRGIGTSAIQKIIETASGHLTTWADFLSAVPSFHRDVGIALIKSGACDCYGMGRNEMVRELEIILGTTVRDIDGKKTEDKGLTEKEKIYFFNQLKQCDTTTKEILSQMAKPPNPRNKTTNRMTKTELIETAIQYFNQMDGIIDGDSKFIYTSDKEKELWLNNLKNKTKKEIETIVLQNGYENKVVKPPCSNEARRQIMYAKATALENSIKDTNTVNATAEKHFLGIALSCSPADDINNNLATHTCLEVAKELNNKPIVVCAVIDNVKFTKTKRGKNPGQSMCFLTISDSTYSIDHAVVFPNAFRKLKTFCKPDLICLIYGDKKNGSFIIDDIRKLI